MQQVSVVAFPMGVGNQPGIAQTIISPWLNSNKSGITFNKERMWLLPVQGISASIVPLPI
jgi:hypothetical protein